MEVPDRDQREAELAAAILILWLLFDDIDLRGAFGYRLFKEGFDQHVRPILNRIYGAARAGLATQFGLDYPTRPSPSTQPTPAFPGAPSTPVTVPDPDGGRQTILIPGLRNRVDQFGEDLYRTLSNRQADQRQRQANNEEVTEFGESDAERISITETTRVHSEGELDAAADVQAKIGTRLVAVWKCEIDPCKVCAPFDGTTREWRTAFPKGPPIHPRCRCTLEWRPSI